MGTMIFSLPADLPPAALADLQHASIAGGQDYMPYLTQVTVEPERMTVSRMMDESGCLLVPWQVTGAGQLMTCSATLMERLEPYQLAVELSRGKLSQLRSQTFEWIKGGLCLADPLAEEIRRASMAFARTLAQVPDSEANQEAQQSLTLSFQAANNLVRAYIDQVFRIRHERQEKLDTYLGCRLASIPPPEQHQYLTQAFNTLCLTIPWESVEPGLSQYAWEQADALVDWALAQGLRVVGGPILDFSGAGLPGWLLQRQADLGSLSGYLCDHVETVLKRYGDRIRQWQLIAANNINSTLAQSDDELLWLAVRAAEAIRHLDPTLELVLGVAQPWGDYLATQERTHSPFVFADTLLRTGIRLVALELELIMGVGPRGSYCRDLLETSRILDLYALLGAPLQVALAYPSAEGGDPLAAHPWQPSGYWDPGFSPEAQAEWASCFAALAMCKPYVRSVHWAHFSDQQPHLLPHCGLLDAAGQPKPALQRLQTLREHHLK